MSDEKKSKVLTVSHPKINILRHELIKSQHADEELKPLYDLVSLDEAGKSSRQYTKGGGLFMKRLKPSQTSRGRRMGIINR